MKPYWTESLSKNVNWNQHENHNNKYHELINAKYQPVFCEIIEFRDKLIKIYKKELLEWFRISSHHNI
jgi:hypothetical protein